jgi:hypothetical protein
MVYKGVVGTTDGGGTLTLPTENVQVGDTYLVSSSGDPIYTKTSDVSIVNNKDYYTLSGTTFTKVGTPVVGSLNTYYEKVNDVEDGDLFIAAGDEYKLTTDTALNGAKTYYTRS